VPTGFTIALYRFRRPIILIAAGLLVVQALIAGFASAHAAAMLADPVGGAVICHGVGGEPAGGGSGSDQGDAWLCCGWCSTAAPGVALPQVPAITFSAGVASPATTPIVALSRHLPARAVRAGPSQAPPAQL
jgi:hypothetical protein